ncbi:MAG: hypothetical protein JJ896_11255 [Rhodothermales bacterium]|nr:hypothetical protein [Rhodothermales bacterium]MBO6780219.1 hypothetical protein [Rhodothermales bacterium]
MSTRFSTAYLLAGVLLLSGCAGSAGSSTWNGGARAEKGSRTPIGWTGVMPSDDAPAPQSQPEADAPAEEAPGTCFVKAPNMEAPEVIQVLKRPERSADGVVIPAEYVSTEVLDAAREGFAWLPAVCEDSLDRHLIMRVQESLIQFGYDVGSVDGIAGPSTLAGLEYFKRDQGLYGEGFTHATLTALGIDAKASGPGFASR